MIAYKNYHAEKTVKLKRRTAMRIKNKIDGSGFVQATSNPLLGELDEDEYRVVIYHYSLMNFIGKVAKDESKWITKERNV
jgi:hypothetical protein